MFLYTMSIFEGKTSEEARNEVSLLRNFFCQSIFINHVCIFFSQVYKKFISVYTIGFIYWPIAQTINFGFVKQRNQVIYVSFASLIWTTFLAYMKVKKTIFLFQQIVTLFTFLESSHRRRINFISLYRYQFNSKAKGSCSRSYRMRNVLCTYFCKFIQNHS